MPPRLFGKHHGTPGRPNLPANSPQCRFRLRRESLGTALLILHTAFPVQTIPCLKHPIARLRQTPALPTPPNQCKSFLCPSPFALNAVLAKSAPGHLATVVVSALSILRTSPARC